MSKKFIKNAVEVIDKRTGRKYEMFEQDVDLNFDGKMVHRYNVGINGYHYWTPVEMLYSDEAFYARYDFI